MRCISGRERRYWEGKGKGDYGMLRPAMDEEERWAGAVVAEMDADV